MHTHSTFTRHLEGAFLANSTMLLSSVCNTPQGLTVPIQAAMAVDLPRTRALQCEQMAANVDKTLHDSSEPLMWPSDNKALHTDHVSNADFQKEYIDIIPTAWTAVSLCLSADATELYVARYRAKEEPLVLRLPFLRHKPDGVHADAFDYENGKGELLDIIEMSDRSCHTSQDLDAKGAKSTWWSERETLDRRLHELLINIEAIWFGGFKSVFSLEQRNGGQLSRFRSSFEDILARYLPSRQGSKRAINRSMPDDEILELFIGLGYDEEGSVDLDEPLADLLYFVVDMLQFSGEHNAYDEIDFDSMSVDVLDALRSYHDARSDATSEGRHLVLVLDRRLQAFPWESMPCLEKTSVSRVGSMLSLRECIVAMRVNSNSNPDLPNMGDGCHLVDGSSGTYILNPDSNLPRTQQTLSPALSKLTAVPSAQWQSLVNEVPTEERFSSALTSSSITLYFGHGAGSQYIRPRAIKRLESCSEVVWLMGCSSGAITEHGHLEPSAVPLAYMLAGQTNVTASNDENAEKPARKCMSVVANLWDVTDKDIDRFSLALGEEWGLWPTASQAELPAKTPKRRQVVVAPSTPQQASKVPKTPKVHKTPAPAKTPARSRSRAPARDGKKLSLVDAVARSRDACYLRYLNGAAPVVYGIPTYLSG